MQQHPVPPASNRRHEVFFFQQSSLVIIFLLAKGACQLSSGTDHADYSHRNENLKRRYPARSVTSYIVWTDEMVIPQKPLGKTYFIVKMAGLAMNQLASCDFWKVL